jgi:uncharacterized coiled-coil protein SlyX
MEKMEYNGRMRHWRTIQEMHRYSRKEVADFGEHNDKLFFYSAEHIENLVYFQQAYIKELEQKLTRIRNAHDKLFMQLDRLQKATRRSLEKTVEE